MTGILAAARDGFLRAALSEALAGYYARTGKWEAAVKLWQNMPQESPFAGSALCGIVAVQTAQALVATRAHLERLAKLRANLDSTVELQLPGNEATILNEVEKELLRYAHGLETALPAKHQKALGLQD